MSERRVNPRVKGPFEGYWDGAGTQAGGRITDLSISGCFVDSVSPPEPSRGRVTVSIATAGGQVSIAAEVIYIEAGQGFAVRFVDLSPAVLAILQHEVDSRLSG